MSTELDNMRGNWGFPTSVRFGVGRIVELPGACRELGIERPLVVTDKGLASLPMLADAVSMLVDAGLGASLFSDVQGNPVEANVDAGLQVYRDGGHDGIVAFGGGSGAETTDTHQTRDPRDAAHDGEDAHEMPGDADAAIGGGFHIATDRVDVAAERRPRQQQPDDHEDADHDQHRRLAGAEAC